MNRTEEGLLRALVRARMYIRKAIKETGQFDEARDILLRANEQATAAIKSYRNSKKAVAGSKEAAKRRAKNTFRKALAIAEGNLLLREDGYPNVPPKEPT